MSGTELAELSLLFSVFVALWICANGDLPKRQNTVVAVASTAEVTMAVVTDGSTKQYTIQSASGNSSIRPYCHATCDGSYNQLQIDDFLFVFDTFGVDIISGLSYPGTASQLRIPTHYCDPVTATFERVPSLFLYLLCRLGSWNNFSATIVGLREMSGPTWLATEPSTCSLGDTVAEGDAALFFHGLDGSIYLAFASSRGLGFCKVGTGEPTDFIDFPSDCLWIAKLSQFDASNIAAECTSGENSDVVVAVWLFNLPDASFTQKWPHQQYNVGQLVFSDDHLIGATWKDATVWLKNLSQSNPPSATVIAKGAVDSVRIIGTGYNSKLVVVTNVGVQQYDLHDVFGGNTESTTLEGSESILTRFDDPTCPSAQIVGDDHIIMPTLKDATYGMAVLSLSGGEPVIVNGVRPARLAFFPGDIIPTHPNATVEGDGLYALYAVTGSPIVIGLIVISVLVAVIVGRMKRNRRGRSITNPVQERDLNTTGVMLTNTTPAPDTSAHFLHSSSRSVTTSGRYGVLPSAATDNVEILHPMEEASDNRPGQMSLAPPLPEGREANGPPDGISVVNV